VHFLINFFPTVPGHMSASLGVTSYPGSFLYAPGLGVTSYPGSFLYAPGLGVINV
jgi:hypothetical protein